MLEFTEERIIKWNNWLEKSKNQVLCGSECSDFRIACGVAHRNEGHQYISKTLESLVITPGYYCDSYHKSLDKKQEKYNQRKAKPEFKIIRGKLFQDKCSKLSKKESKENATYELNIGPK